MSDSSNSSDGIGLSTVLLIIFVVLRLIPTENGQHVINWSWWWVLSPLWIPILLVIAVAIIVASVTTIKGK